MSNSLDEKENFEKQLDSVKESLIDAKHIIWDHIVKEIKKLKDYLIMIEDERALATSCLANVVTVQEGMGDKLFKLRMQLTTSIQNQKLNCILQVYKIEKIL